MLACLVFQTPDTRDLRKYLPEEVEVPLTHFGLNIALPLWQSSPEKRPMNIWHRHESISSPGSSKSGSEDSPEFSLREIHIKDYHKSLRERFLNLRSSSNPSQRAYYYDVKRKQSLAASASRKAKTLQGVLLGAPREVKSYRCRTRPGEFATRYCIFLGSFCLWLPSSLPALSDDKKHFKVELSQGQPHPSPYAHKATPSDPAIRLGIHITGTGKTDHTVSFWLRSRGQQNVLKMNTLIDELEGIPEETTRQMPRRRVA